METHERYEKYSFYAKETTLQINDESNKNGLKQGFFSCFLKNFKCLKWHLHKIGILQKNQD